MASIDSDTQEIEEMPLSIPEMPVSIPEVLVTPQEEVIEEPAAIAPKRKAGRPVGSKNKEVKPRKPREKKVVFAELVEEIQELPRAIAGSHPIPMEAFDLRTARMLRLLQMQSDQRKQQKSQRYSSWFR